MEKHAGILSIAAAIVALATFGAALAFPAIGTCYAGSNGTLPNWFENQNILLFGWLAVFVGQVGWFANIPFALNIRSFLRQRLPSRLAVASESVLVASAAASLQPVAGMSLPHNEGYSEAVCFLGVGFWLWLSAHFTVIMASVALRLGSSTKPGNGS